VDREYADKRRQHMGTVLAAARCGKKIGTVGKTDWAKQTVRSCVASGPLVP